MSCPRTTDQSLQTALVKPALLSVLGGTGPSLELS